MKFFSERSGKKGFTTTPESPVCKCGDKWQKNREAKSDLAKRKHKSRERKTMVWGFTLIEVMVSIFIVAVLAAAIASNTGVGKRNSELKNAVNTFVSNLRKTQNMALSGSTISNCNENNQGSVGILLEQGTSEYLLYSDNNNSNFCENGGGTCSSADATCQDTGGVNEWMEGISMSGDVLVDYVCYFDTGSSSCDSFSTISTAKVSILFIAPDPIIRICDETGYCGYRSITVMFRSPDPSVGSSGITMDTGGRIQRQ